jgi:hypothetical protein
MFDHNLSRARPILPGTSTPAPGPLPTARIYQMSPSAAQSAPGARPWVLEFERSKPLEIDPLTGWTLSSDPLAQVRMTFPDMQSAIGFAERKGWRYQVADPVAPRRRPRLSPAYGQALKVRNENNAVEAQPLEIGARAA